MPKRDSIVMKCITTFFFIVLVDSQPIAPTFWGVNHCDYLPEFYLQDVNPHSSSFSTIPYGLYYQNKTDIIIVGMYLSDTELSIQNAFAQQRLGEELTHLGYRVKNVALNYYAPMSCAMLGYCVNPWTSVFTGYDMCSGYVAGCPPGDKRLSFDQWQKPMIVGKAYGEGGLPLFQDREINYLTLPLFQDTDWTMAWDMFGGLQGDVFIYDYDGRLFSYMCNLDNTLDNPEAWACPDALVGGGLRNQTSYDLALKTAMYAASVVDPNERCADYSFTNDWYDSLNDWQKRVSTMYYVDDWYMYSDFGWNADHSYGSVISIERRHTAHKFQRKIPTYVWASFFAAVATGGTLFVLYRRWKALKAMDGERGTVRFTQLATEDDDLVLEGTLVDYTSIDVAIGGSGNNSGSVKDAGAYGSI